MSRVMVCVETRAGQVQPASLELLTVARQLADTSGGGVEALLVADTAGAAEQLGAADSVVRVVHPALDRCTAEAYGLALAAAIRAREPEVVLFSNSPLGLDVAPAAAARLGWSLVAYRTGLTCVGGSVAARSQVYGAELLAETRTPLPAIFVVNPG